MRSRNHCCRGKRITVTYSECVSLALVIQNANCVRRIILSSVTSPALPIFPHHRTDDMIFRKLLRNKNYVFWFSVQIVSKIFLILRKIEQDIIITVYDLHIKYSLFLSDFNNIFIFCTNFRKILLYQISCKFFQREPSCSMLTDEQTWRNW